MKAFSKIFAPVLIIASVIASDVVTNEADAQTVLTVDATVNSIPGSLIGSDISVGDDATLTFVLDATAPDQNPLSTVGEFNGFQTWDLTIGNDVVLTSNAGSITTNNDFGGFFDALSIFASNVQLVSGDLNGQSVDDSQLSMVSFSTDPVSDDSLNTALMTADNNGYDDRQITLDFGSESAVLGVTNAQVSAVPIPAAAWMFLSGIGCLIGLRKRLS